MPALPAVAEGLRLVTWDPGLTREGPGLLLRDIGRDDPQVMAVVAVIAALDADVLVLTGVDYDAGGAALAALAGRIAAAGADYPHRFALAPNAGVPTGLDLDGDGRTGRARDAQGYGRFPGNGGLAILSRLPVDAGAVQDFSAFLWRDLPGAILPEGEPAEASAIQRLSSTGHWAVPLVRADGGRLTLLAFAATPPVFDGPEDRNGRRNHDEAAFWLRLLEGALPFAAPAPPLVLIGKPNLDPADGEGRAEALLALMSHPALQDPAPRGLHGRVEPGQAGDAALDTALFGPATGGLRVSMILPGRGLAVTGSGVVWPPEADPMAATLASASRHRPVWVDVALP